MLCVAEKYSNIQYIGLNFKCLEKQCVGKCLDLDGDKCPDWEIECSP
jgi:hypothetical protein